MKKWSIILAFVLILVCLAGCGKQEVIPGRPYALEVTYGETSVYAMTGGYAWNWKEGGKTQTVTTDAVDPRAEVQKLSYLSTGEASNMSLDFVVRPDKLMVEVFSADDGFATGQSVELKELTLPAPLDGKDHLYTVTAQWDEDKHGWGSCTYHFRFLDRVLVSDAPVVSDTGDLDLPQVLTMDANGFMGIEFTNYVDDAVKTCLSGKDKQALLQFLKDHIPTELTPAETPMTELMYAMRMVALNGSQLTLSFGTNGSHACVKVGDAVYALQPMDMNTLWAQLNAGSISAAAAATGKNYLDVSETFPMEDWTQECHLGYIQSLENGAAAYDEMRRVDDAQDPRGYRLEKGWSGLSMNVSDDCEFWVLNEDGATYGKVTADGLMQWIENTENDVLFCIYTQDDAIIAICPQPQN